LLDAMVPAIQQTSRLVQEIAAASSEQASGVSQINMAMGQLSQTTQHNAAGAEELASTAEQMSGQAEELQQLVRFFRVPQEQAQGSRDAALPLSTGQRGSQRFRCMLRILMKAISHDFKARHGCRTPIPEFPPGRPDFWTWHTCRA
jgi:ABC-type transporter Mla subunit MlaD